MKTHDYCSYDLEIGCQDDILTNAQTIITAWQKRKSLSAFRQMYQDKITVSSREL